MKRVIILLLLSGCGREPVVVQGTGTSGSWGVQRTCVQKEVHVIGTCFPTWGCSDWCVVEFTDKTVGQTCEPVIGQVAEICKE